MTANFNDAAINQVIDKVVSYALANGRFIEVNGHEPKSAPPPGGPTCSVWAQRIRPVSSSGQAATSAVLELSVRIYISFIQQPYDQIDPQILAAVTDLMGTFSSDFNFGGVAGVRAIDLLGMEGTAMSANAGYVEIDRKMMRVMTITVPIIVNDMFTQAA